MLEFTQNNNVVASIDTFGNLLVNWEIAKLKYSFSKEEIEIGDSLFGKAKLDQITKARKLHPISYYVDTIRSFKPNGKLASLQG